MPRESRVDVVVIQDGAEPSAAGSHVRGAALTETEAVSQAAAAEYYHIAFLFCLKVVAGDGAPAQAASDFQA